MIAEKRISLQEIGLANVTNAIPLLSFSPPPPLLAQQTTSILLSLKLTQLKDTRVFSLFSFNLIQKYSLCEPNI